MKINHIIIYIWNFMFDILTSIDILKGLIVFLKGSNEWNANGKKNYVYTLNKFNHHEIVIEKVKIDQCWVCSNKVNLIKKNSSNNHI